MDEIIDNTAPMINMRTFSTGRPDDNLSFLIAFQANCTAVGYSSGILLTERIFLRQNQ
jgi:hypothetical protein